jgi:cell division protein FtsA
VERIITAIDVGSSKICTLVGENRTTEDEEILRVIGVGIAPARGIRSGIVVNVNDAMSGIAASADKAERISGYAIEGAYVGLSGEHISSRNSPGVVAVAHSDRGVTQDDIDRAIDAAQAVTLPHNQELIHVIPRGFTLDGQAGVHNPTGLQGMRLEAEVHIVTAGSAPLSNLTKCIEGAEITVNAPVLASLASAEAVLSDAEKEMGVVLADIGDGTTDIAIFIEGSPWYSAVIPLGGHHITNDIAVGLSAPYPAAEDLKVKYGHAVPEMINEDEEVDSASFGDYPRQTVSRRKLAEIIEARAEEIFELILREIKRSGYDGLLPAGLVLVGGTAQLGGLKEFGRRVLRLPVRVGASHDLEGLADAISSPAYAASAGLLLWGMRYGEERGSSGRRRRVGLSSRFNDWLRKAFRTD